jgi:hypothetical protein
VKTEGGKPGEHETGWKNQSTVRSRTKKRESRSSDISSCIIDISISKQRIVLEFMEVRFHSNSSALGCSPFLKSHAMFLASSSVTRDANDSWVMKSWSAYSKPGITVYIDPH